MPDSLFVALDRSRLRVYKEPKPFAGRPRSGLEVLANVDFPDGRANYSDRDTDQAGHFPTNGSASQSMDERLPMKEEQERRIIDDLVSALEPVLRQNPGLTWHLAAGPELLQPVLSKLDPGLRRRLGRSIEKNVAHLPADELPGRFV